MAMSAICSLLCISLKLIHNESYIFIAGTVREVVLVEVRNQTRLLIDFFVTGHEEERLIRAWVTPKGEEIRLAVKEIDVFQVTVGLKENQWYHICQSWSTKTGHWDLFLNGKLKSHGYNPKVCIKENTNV